MASLDGHSAGAIVTPEAVLLDFQLAGVGSRAVAFGVDLALQVAALFAFFAVLGTIGGGGSDLAAIILLLVGMILIVLGYPVVMETLNGGRTLGRSVVGTRVVSVEGAPIRFRQALIRSLLGIVDLFASAGAVAVITALLTRRGQRLGDLVAGTMVIRERNSNEGSGAIRFWPPTYLAAWSESIDTRGLGNDGYQVLREYLTRPDLVEPARSTLGLEVLTMVEQRLPHAPRPAEVGITDYLTAVAAAAQTPVGGPGSALAQPPPPTTAPKFTMLPAPPSAQLTPPTFGAPSPPAAFAPRQKRSKASQPPPPPAASPPPPPPPPRTTPAAPAAPAPAAPAAPSLGAPLPPPAPVPSSAAAPPVAPAPAAPAPPVAPAPAAPAPPVAPAPAAPAPLVAPVAPEPAPPTPAPAAPPVAPAPPAPAPPPTPEVAPSEPAWEPEEGGFSTPG